MNDGKLKAIPCDISRGGFSDERVFSISIDGVNHSGVASRRHMWTVAGDQVEEGEPPIGKVIKGFVAARIIRVIDKQEVMVSIPDGEVITIPIGALVDRPLTARKHVFV